MFTSEASQGLGDCLGKHAPVSTGSYRSLAPLALLPPPVRAAEGDSSTDTDPLTPTPTLLSFLLLRISGSHHVNEGGCGVGGAGGGCTLVWGDGEARISGVIENTDAD